MNRKLDGLHTAGRHNDPESFFGVIERGTYHDQSFTDEGYGLVLDATWEPDEQHGAPIAARAVNVPADQYGGSRQSAAVVRLRWWGR